MNHLAIHPDLAAVSPGLADHVRAEENAHESGFSRAVFPDEPDDLALMEGQIDVREHLIAEEVLSDVPHLKERSFFIAHVNCAFRSF